MYIQDSAAVTSRELTPEGFLKVKANIGRAGLHDYRAAELGPLDGFGPDDRIRVYRPPEEVFDPASMASFAGKPVTSDHPPKMVDARNWRRYAIGQSGEQVTRDGDHMAAELLITDADAVARAQSGAQLSNGYQADFDFVPGTAPDGTAYHAIQRNIRGNHIALVDAGRCGDSCRVGDCAGGAPRLTTVTVGGVAVETTEEGAAALAGVQLSLEAKDGAIAALQAKVLDGAAVEALATERSAVVDAARHLLGPSLDVAGLSTDAIRRAVAARLLGTAAIENRSDTYVRAAFDTLLVTSRRGNPLASHLAHGGGDPSRTAEQARRDRDRFLSQAWKHQPSHGDA